VVQLSILSAEIVDEARVLQTLLTAAFHGISVIRKMA